ncbi:TPA: hypothetical protein ACH3X3_000227 [Trebouxia sp. C0006]
MDGTASGVPGSRTFYKRTLPCPPAVAFSSSEGKALFADALLDGTLQGFFKLIEQFRTQDEPAFCGLASLAMVLNALAIDPRRAWKGPWRWFHEQMLDCCQPLSTVIETGINLDQAACLARCNGAMAELVRYDSLSEEKFRATVQEICASDQQHVIVSYSRKQFLQTGDGHFSPIGGFHASKDMVLILDTARFKYPPHWVPMAQLHQAMAAVDPATGKARGFIRLAANPKLDSVMFTLKRPTRAWQQVRTFMDTTLPDILISHQNSKPALLTNPRHSHTILTLPLPHFLTTMRLSRQHLRGTQQSDCSVALACIPPAAAASFLNELHSTEIYRVVQQCVQESTDALQLDVCSRSNSHSGRAASLRPQAGSEPTCNFHNNDSHASSSHNQLIGLSKGTLTTTEPSLSPKVDNLPSDDLRISAAEKLTVINNLECKASCAQSDSAEFASAQLPSTTISSCCRQPSMESQSHEAAQKQRQQSSNSLDALQSLATGSAAVGPDADSPGSMTESMSQHAKQLRGVEALCMFLLVTTGVWSLVKDVQVQAQVWQMMDMSSYAIVASEVAYLAAQWNELPALQTLESEGSNLTCAACSDN